MTILYSSPAWNISLAKCQAVPLWLGCCLLGKLPLISFVITVREAMKVKGKKNCHSMEKVVIPLTPPYLPSQRLINCLAVTIICSKADEILSGNLWHLSQCKPCRCSVYLPCALSALCHPDKQSQEGITRESTGADTSPPLPHCFLLAKGHNLQNKLQLQNKEKLPRSAQGTA